MGNSSVAIRECSFLGVPAINIGTRQFGRQRGVNVVDVDYNTDQIYKALTHMVERGNTGSEEIYGDGKAGEKIADVLSKCPLTFEKRLTY